MAMKLTTLPSQPDYAGSVTIGGKEYAAAGYESAYFADGVVGTKHDYYVRHADDDLCQPVSVKREKGLTVNFWGTIVTSEPIDFENEDEVMLWDWNMEEI